MKRWLLRLLVVVVIASAIGAAVALNDQKRRLGEMSDDELKAFLGRKLEGRVPPEKMEQIQEKVTAAVRSGQSSVEAGSGNGEVVAEASGDIVNDVVEAVAEGGDTEEDTEG